MKKVEGDGCKGREGGETQMKRGGGRKERESKWWREGEGDGGGEGERREDVNEGWRG